MNTGSRGAGLAAAVMVLVAGCGGGSGGGKSTPTTAAAITVHGTITITGDSDEITWVGGDGGGLTSAGPDDGYQCGGTGGYDDIDADAQVVISSDTGKTLAIGTIPELGTYTGTPDDGTCVLKWTVKDVPTAEKFYNIKIGHRDGPKWTLADLKKGPALTLG